MTSGSEPFRSDLLAGEHVLVTGGGTGLGAAMAARCASLGAAVTIVGRRRDPLDTTAAAIRAAGGQALGVSCDVRKPERVQAAVDLAEERQGPVTRLINNAAGNFLAFSEDLQPRGFDAVVQINLYGGFHATLACGRRWIERGAGGVVLTIATTYAETGSAYVLPSAASKAALVALTRSLAVEWGPHRIRLNAIGPGPIPTPGAWSRLIPDPSAATAMERAVPLGRFATADELSTLAVFLLSDASASITGQLVELDGGARLAGSGSFNAWVQRPREELARWFDALRPPRPRPRDGGSGPAPA